MRACLLALGILGWLVPINGQDTGFTPAPQQFYQEIATRLGLSLSQVKNNIFRGRRTLRRLLSNHQPSNRN